MPFCNCFYCKYFLSPGALRHNLFYPIKRLYWKVWFAPIRWLKNYNEALIPRNQGMSVYEKYLRPFHGYVVRLKEGEGIGWKWWKFIKRENL